MKNVMFFKLSLFCFAYALCLPHSFAQDSPQWGLPEGTKPRLGNGTVNEVQYSPDGNRLAVASGIGIWLYNVATLQEIALLTGHTGRIESVAFSPDGDTVLLWELTSSTAFGVEPLAMRTTTLGNINGRRCCKIIRIRSTPKPEYRISWQTTHS